MRQLIGVLVSLLLAGCFPDKTFTCDADYTGISDSVRHCDKDERCIQGHCATRDPTCTIAPYRYTRSAGATLNGQCIMALPDGGLPCAVAGEMCDDGNACTENDVCQMDGTTCKGTPKMCPTPSCSNGMAIASSCDPATGMCATKMTACAPYSCKADKISCQTVCTQFQDCGPGFYCSASHCASCDDFLSGNSFQPQFSTPMMIPMMIPGTINTPSVEEGATLSADRLSLYFTSDRAGGPGGKDLYVAKRTDPTAAFGTPQLLGMTNINSPQDDEDLFTADGTTFYFASNRPGGSGDFDLYSATRDMTGNFSTPATILSGGAAVMAINTMGREAAPSLTGDGKRLFFESDRLSPPVTNKFGDAWLQIFTASANPFGAAAQVTKLETIISDPLFPITYSWVSPSVGQAGKSLYLVNVGVPARTELAAAHLDATGNVSTPPSLLTNPPGTPLDVGAGNRLSISPDGCTILMTSKKTDPKGDLLWSYRTSVQNCPPATTGCGSADGCCPAACTGTVDSDCPFPRTNLVQEYYSKDDDNHAYYLAGETPPAGYITTPTSVKFRVFVDAVSGSLPLYRTSSTMCDGKLYSYVTTDTSTPHGSYSVEQKLGYVTMVMVNNSSRIYRAKKETAGATPSCDMQLKLTQAECVGLTGYTCEQNVGFVLQP